MKLIYLEDENKYIDLDSKYYPGDVYTDDDLDFLLQLESEYRKSLPHFTFYQLIEMFPTAKQAARRGVIAKIKEIKESINRVDELRVMILKEFEEKYDLMEYDIFKKEIEEETLKKIEDLQMEKNKYEHQRQFLNREIKKETARKKLEKEMKKKEPDKEVVESAKYLMEAKKGFEDAIDDHLISKAKEVPITSLMEVRRDGKAKCFHHNDKTPSLHVYKRKNNFHCFSCGAHGSAIDVVMALQGLDFKGAVKYLNKL